MNSSRSHKTLRRAPNYYSKNIFISTSGKGEHCQADDLFWLEGTPYLAEKNVGAGAFGLVCKATDTRYGKKVAIKKIPRVLNSHSSAKSALREIRILRELSHENVINATDVFMMVNSSGSDLYAVMDLMETDLHCVLQSTQRLSERHFRFFFYQLLRGLKYLHSADIIHRDLKPSNLLLNADCSLKIADFGISRSSSSTKTSEISPSGWNSSGNLSSYVSTLWYRAPEILFSLGEYDTKVDMWSAGCILAEMLLRRAIFPGKDSYSQIKLIIECMGSPESNVIRKVRSPKIRDHIISCGPTASTPLLVIFPDSSTKARDIMSFLLQVSPNKRATAEQALEHSFVAQWHNVQNEKSCPDAIRRSLQKSENLEGELIMRMLEKEANNS